MELVNSVAGDASSVTELINSITRDASSVVELINTVAEETNSVAEFVHSVTGETTPIAELTHFVSGETNLAAFSMGNLPEIETFLDMETTHVSTGQTNSSQCIGSTRTFGAGVISWHARC